MILRHQTEDKATRVEILARKIYINSIDENFLELQKKADWSIIAANTFYQTFENGIKNEK